MIPSSGAPEISPGLYKSFAARLISPARAGICTKVAVKNNAVPQNGFLYGDGHG
jgi:hypothetical protein